MRWCFAGIASFKSFPNMCGQPVFAKPCGLYCASWSVYRSRVESPIFLPKAIADSAWSDVGGTVEIPFSVHVFLFEDGSWTLWLLLVVLLRRLMIPMMLRCSLRTEGWWRAALLLVTASTAWLGCRRASRYQPLLALSRVHNIQICGVAMWLFASGNHWAERMVSCWASMYSVGISSGQWTLPQLLMALPRCVSSNSFV